MKYYTIPPPQSLKKFARYYLALEHGLAPNKPPYIYRSIADGCAELAFHYRGLFNDIVKINKCVAGNPAYMHSIPNTGISLPLKGIVHNLHLPYNKSQ
jgi:hypothetical protein